MGYLNRAAIVGVLSGSVWLLPAQAASPSLESPSSLAPFTPDSVAAWRFVGIPKASVSLPPTQFDVSREDGEFALRIQTNASYGTWVHDLPQAPAGKLRWRWRLDEPLKGGIAAPDLLTKAGDDAALKVCLMFNHDLQRVPFWERTTLRVARSVSGKTCPPRLSAMCGIKPTLWDKLGATPTRRAYVLWSCEAPNLRCGSGKASSGMLEQISNSYLLTSIRSLSLRRPSRPLWWAPTAITPKVRRWAG